MAIANKYKLKVIEDAAQSPGALYKGKTVGTIGHIGGFSFNFHKHIHTGEGGLIVTNNDDLALRSQLIRNHGENAVEEFNIDDISNLIGGNYRWTELQAAIASAQLKKLDAILAKRRYLAKHLTRNLNSIPGITLPLDEKDTHSSHYMYPIKFDPEIVGISRNVFVRAVSSELPKAKYWDTTPLAEGYIKPLYLSKLYQDKIAIGKKGFPFNVNKDRNYQYKKGDCPITESLYESQLIITPLVNESISENDLNDLSNSILKVLENIDELKKGNFENSDKVFDPIAAIDETVE